MKKNIKKNYKKTKKQKEPEGIKVDMSTIFSDAPKEEKYIFETVTTELNERISNMMVPFFELVKASVISRLKKEKSVEASVYALRLDGGIVYIPVHMPDNSADKEATMRKIGWDLANKGLDFISFAFVSEAWMSIGMEVDKEDKRTLEEIASELRRPSEDPNRREVLIIAAENCLKHSNYFLSIINRDPVDGTVSLDDKNETISGINSSNWKKNTSKIDVKLNILDNLINSYVQNFAKMYLKEKKDE